MTRPRLAHILLVISLSLGPLPSCSLQQAAQGAGKIAQIIADPTMPVGPPKDQPSKATISLYVEEDVNKNTFGQAAPVDIWVFQLSDDTRLKTLDFATLASSPREALGSAYVTHKEAQVEPGRSKIVKDWEIKEDTSEIGVAVGYREIERVNWRNIDAIKPRGEIYNIVIAIRGSNVVIQTHR